MRIIRRYYIKFLYLKFQILTELIWQWNELWWTNFIAQTTTKVLTTYLLKEEWRSPPLNARFSATATTYPYVHIVCFVTLFTNFWCFNYCTWLYTYVWKSPKRETDTDKIGNYDIMCANYTVYVCTKYKITIEVYISGRVIIVRNNNSYLHAFWLVKPIRVLVPNSVVNK